MSRVVGRELLDLCRAWGQSSLASAYYLAGGTALALQIGHRRSVDLGWFRRSADGRVPAQGIARELERLFGPEHAQPVRRQIDQATWAVKGIRFLVRLKPSSASVWQPSCGARPKVVPALEATCAR